ncbi:hypothetical protein [Lysobacter sp. CFH 32150]|uniref:hypothetical protein n=1 Tax=Lysobacter sp. CFH 32150 TaxID=2927128 RepID=UPI001FA70F71|nr:hypothetical protein [Lysobacter sp. CFH 32150]MCI4569039.1 hypothetical protein [Lysobacter sp. CFH 32150]
MTTLLQTKATGACQPGVAEAQQNSMMSMTPSRDDLPNWMLDETRINTLPVGNTLIAPTPPNA